MSLRLKNDCTSRFDFVVSSCGLFGCKVAGIKTFYSSTKSLASLLKLVVSAKSTENISILLLLLK